jgi:hypothetical protein
MTVASRTVRSTRATAFASERFGVAVIEATTECVDTCVAPACNLAEKGSFRDDHQFLDSSP